MFCFHRFAGVNETVSMTRSTMVESANNGMNGQGEHQGSTTLPFVATSKHVPVSFTVSSKKCKVTSKIYQSSHLFHA